MYNKNGDFGKVRLAHLLPTEQELGLFSLSCCGWHHCNDRYQLWNLQDREHLLLFTVSGCGIMRVNEREYRLPAGTVAFIPRHSRNGYGTPPNGLWEFYWVHPRGALAEHFLDTLATKGILTGSADPTHRYGERVESLMSHCGQPLPDRLKLSQDVGELLHLLAKDLQEASPSATISVRAIRYLEQRFWEPLVLEDVARSLFLSPAHLIRLFKKEVGCTPHQYLIHYRLVSATELLQFSDMQIQEIAAAVGFSSASHFIACFRQHYGCTPSQYLGRR